MTTPDQIQNNPSVAREDLPWLRVTPPLWWAAANAFIVGDRHLPDGTRQHLVQGFVAPGLVVSNAQVISDACVDSSSISDEFSHLSGYMKGIAAHKNQSPS